MVDVTRRQGTIGTVHETTNKPTWYTGGLTSSPADTSYDPTGTLLDFSNVNLNGKSYSGTYNPTQGGGSSLLTQDYKFVDAAANTLLNPNASSLSELNLLKSNNQSDNPFFNEFFSYYLGIAQERQAQISRGLQRKDLLTGSGSLL